MKKKEFNFQANFNRIIPDFFPAIPTPICSHGGGISGAVPEHRRLRNSFEEPQAIALKYKTGFHPSEPLRIGIHIHDDRDVQ